MNGEFDPVSYAMGQAAGGGGGGGEAVLIDKTINANGTYNASSDNADGYKKAVVNVPNSYAAGDEGKVVSNGALVAQGSDTVNQNGLVDTTLISALTVNVSGGGGSNWTLIGSAEFEVNTSSTTEAIVGNVELSSYDFNKDDIIWIHVRDKAGKRNGYFFGNDTIFSNVTTANGNPNGILSQAQKMVISVSSAGTYSIGSSSYGVYAYTVSKTQAEHNVLIKSKYNSSNGTINGTYKVDVYKLTPASGRTIFDA